MTKSSAQNKKPLPRALHDNSLQKSLHTVSRCRTKLAPTKQNPRQTALGRVLTGASILNARTGGHTEPQSYSHCGCNALSRVHLLSCFSYLQGLLVRKNSRLCRRLDAGMGDRGRPSTSRVHTNSLLRKPRQQVQRAAVQHKRSSRGRKGRRKRATASRAGRRRAKTHKKA